MKKRIKIIFYSEDNKKIDATQKLQLKSAP